MSCKCNGAPMCEGRHNYAMMPATVICDSHHPVDRRPLTRERILAIPGVGLLPQAEETKRKHVSKYVPKEARRVYGRISDEDLAGMVARYDNGSGASLNVIAEHYGRDRSTIRAALRRVGVYRAIYAQTLIGGAA